MSEFPALSKILAYFYRFASWGAAEMHKYMSMTIFNVFSLVVRVRTPLPPPLLPTTLIANEGKYYIMNTVHMP